MKTKGKAVKQSKASYKWSKFIKNIQVCWNILFGRNQHYVILSVTDYELMNIRRKIEGKGEEQIPVEIATGILDLPLSVVGVILTIALKDVDTQLGFRTQDHIGFQE